MCVSARVWEADQSWQPQKQIRPADKHSMVDWGGRLFFKSGYKLQTADRHCKHSAHKTIALPRDNFDIVFFLVLKA